MNKDEMKEKVNELNEKIDILKAERDDFIEKHRSHFAEYQIGEVLYNISNGMKGMCINHWYRRETESTDIHCEIFESNYITSDLLETTSKYKFLEMRNSNMSNCFNYTLYALNWIRYEDYENKSDEYISRLESLSKLNNK